MIKILISLLFLIGITGVLFCLAITPRTSKSQPALETRNTFEYQTKLKPHVDSSLPELLYLRRVRDSQWQTSGEHTNYQLNDYQEASMTVVNIKPDAYLKNSTEEHNRIIIGRLSDRGSGMHGWHITMIRQGERAIDFERHQRYRVWIEKEHPIGFNDEGEPISKNPKRWYFAGPADIIARQHYNGYLEPEDGDK